MRKSFGLAALCLLGWVLLGGNVQQVVNSVVATTCSAQFVRAISATGAATCATIANADLPGVQSKAITFTRDLTAANGNVGYTGVGFTPKSCLALAAVAASATQDVQYFGFMDTSGTGFNISVSNSLFTYSAAFITASAAGGNSQSATWVSYDADGFTLAWTKAGAPTGTLTVSAICFR